MAQREANARYAADCERKEATTAQDDVLVDAPLCPHCGATARPNVQGCEGPGGPELVCGVCRFFVCPQAPEADPEKQNTICSSCSPDGANALWNWAYINTQGQHLAQESAMSNKDVSEATPPTTPEPEDARAITWDSATAAQVHGCDSCPECDESFDPRLHVHNHFAELHCLSCGFTVLTGYYDDTVRYSAEWQRVPRLMWNSVAASEAEHQEAVDEALDTVPTSDQGGDAEDQEIETAADRDPVDHPGPCCHDMSPDVTGTIEAWGLRFSAGCVVKYVAKSQRENGLRDLRKAAWYLGMLIRQQEAKEAHEETNARSRVMSTVDAKGTSALERSERSDAGPPAPWIGTDLDGVVFAVMAGFLEYLNLRKPKDARRLDLLDLDGYDPCTWAPEFEDVRGRDAVLDLFEPYFMRHHDLGTQPPLHAQICFALRQWNREHGTPEAPAIFVTTSRRDGWTNWDALSLSMLATPSCDRGLGFRQPFHPPLPVTPWYVEGIESDEARADAYEREAIRRGCAPQLVLEDNLQTARYLQRGGFKYGNALTPQHAGAIIMPQRMWNAGPPATYRRGLCPQRMSDHDVAVCITATSQCLRDASRPHAEPDHTLPQGSGGKENSGS